MANINNVSDLRGVVRLAIDAMTGITDLVEDLHHTIASGAGILGAPDQHRTTGITGLVYRNIRAVSGLVGGAIDAGLDPLVSLLGEKDSAPGREALLAALNGVLGDHLAASNNPLAIPMQLRRNGALLAMDDCAFMKAILESGGKLALMVHGSCMNDLQWNRQGHDYGADLARDLGYLPIYLHYNTGLHISENGRSFSELMETFMNQLPRPPELVIIAHSMGGLVSRSACHYGKLAGHTWLNHLRKLVFLGTPHHGAPLERGGNWIDMLLEISPYSAPFSRLGKIRSAGVSDLRYGNLLDDDWKGRDRFEHSGDSRVAVPLPDGVQCYAIAATIVKESSKIGDHLIGDGLVTLNSALGRHENADLNLSFPETHQWVGRDMNHLDLLNQPEVYETIKHWLKDEWFQNWVCF
jgi:pimeloyl-ACP methyl ester carboxylesterase